MDFEDILKTIFGIIVFIAVIARFREYLGFWFWVIIGVIVLIVVAAIVLHFYLNGIFDEDKVTVSTPFPLLDNKNDQVAVPPGLTAVVEDCKSKDMLYSCITFTVYVKEET